MNNWRSKVKPLFARRPGFIAGLLVLAALAGLPALAQEILTPHHVAKIRAVSDAVIAPDGARVAYVSRVPRRPLEDEDGAAWAELHVVRPDGESAPFVTGQVSVSEIAWAPGGGGISFLAKRGSDKTTCLYVIPVAGGEARRIFSHDTDITGYSWSRDGKRVAFLAAEAVPEAVKKLRDKGFNQQIYEEDWKPVKVWIAEVDAERTKPRALDLAGSASELHWSPAGDVLAVALAPTPLVDDSYMSRTLHVVEAASGKVVARVEHRGKFGAVRWSPDGKHLALIAAADINDTREGRLMVVPATGGAPRDLLPGWEGHVTSIAWRDPDTILFTADLGVSSTFGSIRRDGAMRKALAPQPGAVLSNCSVSNDGRSVAFLGRTPRHPAEVFLQSGDTPLKRLTTSNPWLDKVRLAPQEVVTYKARDGLRLEGLLIRPLDEEKGKRYPLIVDVHGGPEAHYSNGWLTTYSSLGQMAAARGFAVFYPNYRGSTGRGVAFARSSQGDPAGKEFDDIVDGVDHLVATGLADNAKVGITGGSYGGFATAWGATFYSHRFAAGVMFVGISDLVSKLGSTDIPNEMYHLHYLKWPWEMWDLLRERSPIYHARKHRTPLLIMHGSADPRVHPSQSLQLYRYLKLMGQAPVRLVWYPGEGHGNQRAASRLDYSLRALQWMEHYLKGPGGTPPPYELSYEAAVAN